jgi:hypothetical protein
VLAWVLVRTLSVIEIWPQDGGWAGHFSPQWPGLPVEPRGLAIRSAAVALGGAVGEALATGEMAEPSRSDLANVAYLAGLNAADDSERFRALAECLARRALRANWTAVERVAGALAERRTVGAFAVAELVGARR